MSNSDILKSKMVILKIQFILSLIEKDADLNCLPKTIINWLND